MLRTSSPPEIHDEIMGILRTLTELVQGLTWYGNDLDDVADARADDCQPDRRQHHDKHS